MPHEILSIRSLDDPDLAPYRTMRRSVDHRRLGIFVAEGEKVVRRMLESDFPVVSLLLPERHLPEFQELLNRRANESIKVYLAEKGVLEELIGFSLFQGILGVGRIPPQPGLNELLQKPGGPRLFVAVEAIANAINIGVIARNSVAFGATALLVGETSCSPFLRRAVRNSMGTIFKIPVLELEDLQGALALLNQRGVQTIAAHPHVDGQTLFDLELGGDICLVFGQEGEGLSQRILDVCQQKAAIPMASGVDSLNVSVASGAFLSEVFRQRRQLLPAEIPEGYRSREKLPTSQ
jgi:tRNA G18 (ribose-2'-O)-methylase SpoU